VRYLEVPRQSELFDVFADILSPVAYRRLHGSWQHLFQRPAVRLRRVFVAGFELVEKSRSFLRRACSPHEAAAFERLELADVMDETGPSKAPG